MDVGLLSHKVEIEPLFTIDAGPFLALVETRYTMSCSKQGISQMPNIFPARCSPTTAMSCSCTFDLFVCVVFSHLDPVVRVLDTLADVGIERLGMFLVGK